MSTTPAESRPRRRRGALTGCAFRIVAALIPLTLFVGLAEVAVRLVVPADRWRYVDATHQWTPDPTTGWAQIRNLDTVVIETLTNRAIPLRTNGDGLLPRSAARDKPEGTTRILFIGDSTVVGAGVDEGERIHAVLQEKLNERFANVDVINAGTQGFSTDQAMLRLEQVIGQYAPDIVLHAVCTNDFVANTLDANYGINKPRFTVGEDGELVARPFTPNAAIREMGSGPTKWIQRSALYRMLRPRLVVLRARLGGWEERNLIGMASDWYYEPEALERVDWPLFGALIARMHRTAAEHSAQFAVFVHPDVGATWDPVIEDTVNTVGASRVYDRLALERRVGEELAGRGVPFVPMVDYFARQQERGPFHLLPRDPHCNATGYVMEAELLEAFLAESYDFAGEPIAR